MRTGGVRARFGGRRRFGSASHGVAGAGCGGSATVTSCCARPPHPARPGRRSACHRAPRHWRPGCGCPMIT